MPEYIPTDDLCDLPGLSPEWWLAIDADIDYQREQGAFESEDDGLLE